MKRSGLITTKMGMTRLYDDAGVAHAVTVLSVGDCTVIGNRTVEKNGYVANVLGMREAKAKHVAKPQAIAAEKAGVKPYRKIVEFRVSDDCVIPVGTSLSASHFVAGQFVDVQATSKGKGFQGAMKRHNFGGKEATHGVLKAHRSLGGTGMREWPGRVLKGKKILVVHPFAETIKSQYENKRRLIFPGTEILPEFDLHILKAVQTIAGTIDPRFPTWFDALNYMTEECLKINFDICTFKGEISFAQ